MSKWIEWKGKEACPVHGKRVEVKFRSGETKVTVGDKGSGLWFHYELRFGHTPYDIVAYRLLPAANDNLPVLDATAKVRAERINDLVTYFHGKSAGNGWWPQHMRDNPLTVSNKLALIHSEISEAMEGDRKNLMDDKLPHRKMIEVELGDALIRICDLAGFLGLDLGGATMEKDGYNDVRADHKTETRKLAGGKAY